MRNDQSVDRHEEEVALLRSSNILERTQYWKRFYDSPECEFLKAPVEIGRLGVISEIISSHAPHSRVLDVGCGFGKLSELVSHFVHTYVGLDISEPVIREASEKHKNCKFLCLPFEQFDSDPNSYDVVVFSEVLYYCDHHAALAKASTILDKTGYIIASIYDSPSGEAILNDIFQCRRVIQHISVTSHDAALRWHILLISGKQV